MKFFKHYCDARNGTTMNAIFDADGHRGVSVFWMLVEICGEAMNKERDEEWCEDDCVFRFHDRFLRRNLRVSPGTLRNLLGIFQGFAGVSSVLVGNVWEIRFPKMLEILNRDAKRTRPGRVRRAPNKEEKEKEKEKERETPLPQSAPRALTELSLWWNESEGCRDPIKERTREHEMYEDTLKPTRTEAEWKAIFARVHRSKFLQGSRKWKADFDWAVDARNVDKILSGKFDDPDGGGDSNVIDWERVFAPRETT